nr:C3 [uncultured bacterium]
MQVREISMIAEIFTVEETLHQMDDLAKAKNPTDTKWAKNAS